MKHIITTIFVASLFASCTGPAKVDTSKCVEELKSTEKAWCDMATSDGFAKTVDLYYTDDVVLINSGYPVDTKAGLRKRAEEHPEYFKGLTWANTKAEVASSGDMGYTWGRWQQKTTTKEGADTTYYGVYSTVWKKGEDGKWRAILDETNNTPKPE